MIITVTIIITIVFFIKLVTLLLISLTMIILVMFLTTLTMIKIIIIIIMKTITTIKVVIIIKLIAFCRHQPLFILGGSMVKEMKRLFTNMKTEP